MHKRLMPKTIDENATAADKTASPWSTCGVPIDVWEEIKRSVMDSDALKDKRRTERQKTH
jgi:hypothetical protein